MELQDSARPDISWETGLKAYVERTGVSGIFQMILGSAAARQAGTDAGNVPVLDNGGNLSLAVIPGRALMPGTGTAGHFLRLVQTISPYTVEWAAADGGIADAFGIETGDTDEEIIAKVLAGLDTQLGDWDMGGGGGGSARPVYAGAAPPTDDDDESVEFSPGLFFQVGDYWLYNDIFWKLSDATAGAAVWVRLGLNETEIATLAALTDVLTQSDGVPPVNLIANSASSLNLSMDHHTAILDCTHATPTLVLRNQADYAWGNSTILQILSNNNLTLDTGNAIVINGGTAGANYTLTGGATAGMLIRRGSNSWKAVGPWTVV